ncbi:hypothetical protein MesoLjLc_18200 [Mesorhizobium sp. L-8-10]|uniref:hypothetical protein n=1 Tax=Mesorhizobium sp. L-8-10 TaxID=2744523 RepID=UPI00192634F3|nr:hypothetical protein [Mesorhizobium sp. L-8-10]BCH29890.1 hypothetical protein MesoLjLc_18200 [Mesorhizobium sp. L-8-10]
MRFGGDTDEEFQELLLQLEAMMDTAEIPAMLDRLLKTYGLKSIAYLGTCIVERPDNQPYLAVTYSRD